ncbi:hypothetical protein L484_000395 [Morus notabilis]|uniref:X8 domain-containing protein n=1 Tax=Morus notabilis TaxID=981085 RepID=W9SQ46_9ROSA|nr:hypothetical protein L484_000395 [Morus notabilis]
MAQKQKSVSLASFSLFLLFLSDTHLSDVSSNDFAGETLAAEILQTWCVAKPSSSDSLLRDNIDFACDHVQDECNPIKLGNSNPCYNPNTPIHHASFAMNAYYQKKERHQWNCNFENSGLISITNPSISFS